MLELTDLEYQQQIRSLAEEAGQIKDQEDRDTWIHETVDGHRYVIYTYLAQLVIAYSTNSEAYADMFGGELDLSDPMAWSRVAYCAMEQDIRDRLD